MKEILQPVEVGSLSHYLQGFLHPRWWFGISSINSTDELKYPSRRKKKKKYESLATKNGGFFMSAAVPDFGGTSPVGSLFKDCSGRGEAVGSKENGPNCVLLDWTKLPPVCLLYPLVVDSRSCSVPDGQPSEVWVQSRSCWRFLWDSLVPGRVSMEGWDAWDVPFPGCLRLLELPYRSKWRHPVWR